MVQQRFKNCFKICTTDILQLGQQYGYGAKTMKQGSLMHIGVEMVALESAMKYGTEDERYLTTTLECLSAQNI